MQTAAEAPASSSRRSDDSASTPSPIGASCSASAPSIRAASARGSSCWPTCWSSGSDQAWSSSTIAAPFSATMNVGALVLPDVTAGIPRRRSPAGPNPCTLQPMVDDRRRRVRTHAAGAGCVENAARPARMSSDELALRRDRNAGLELLLDQLRHRRLRRDCRISRTPASISRHILGRGRDSWGR